LVYSHLKEEKLHHKRINRGYFGIGVYHPKTEHNIGTLWRSAYQLGAAYVFTINGRYRRQASDTLKTWRHIPLFYYESFENFQSTRPYDCLLVGIEMDGENIVEYSHPERAIYLLGAEDHGLPPSISNMCNQIISLPSIRTNSFNVAIAGSLVMFDRLTKSGE